MPTHLYCLLPARSELTPPASVRALALGDVTAWVGDTDEVALSRDARVVARATIEHDRVVGAALAQGVTPVPSALADAYRDDDEASADIRGHIAAIREALARTTGLIEMTTIIGLTDEAPAADAGGRGRAYLEQLRTQPARTAAIADRVAVALTALAGEPRRRPGSGTFALSHLIPRGDISRYRTLSLSLAGQGYRIVIDGPRAPYSFARFSPRQGIFNEGSASAA